MELERYLFHSLKNIKDCGNSTDLWNYYLTPFNS